MILFELVGTENDDTYQELEMSNGLRQYDFLRDIIIASVKMQRKMMSHQIIKALNYHAITCLHTNAGEYRPCQVTVGDHVPPAHFRVPALMDDFVDLVNRRWLEVDPLFHAAWILWRLNFIHPFINGNGRTARAIAYFFICARVGGPLPGRKILPGLIKENRETYVLALQHADATAQEGQVDLLPMVQLLDELLKQQLASADEVIPEVLGSS